MTTDPGRAGPDVPRLHPAERPIFLTVPRFNLSALPLLALTGPVPGLIVKRMKPLT